MQNDAAAQAAATGSLLDRLIALPWALASFAWVTLVQSARTFPKGAVTFVGVASKQLYFTGWESLRLTFQVAFFLGIIVVAQLSAYVKGLGGIGLVGKIIVLALLREVIPLFMAIILIARSGTAIASELALMKVNGEIRSIESMGINYLYYLIATRLAAFTAAFTGLTLLAAFVSVMSGSVATYLFQKVSFVDFFDAFYFNLNLADIVFFIVKSAVFGFTIPLICCFFGLSIKRSTTEIPQLSTRAVMVSFFYVFLFNVIIDFAGLPWM